MYFKCDNCDVAKKQKKPCFATESKKTTKTYDLTCLFENEESHDESDWKPLTKEEFLKEIG